jgi:hypothetical protein
MNKKGQLGTLQNVVLALVVIGFLITFGVIMLGKLTTTAGDDADAANASGEVKKSVMGIVGYLPLIVLAFIMLIVLGAIFMVSRYSASK